MEGEGIHVLVAMGSRSASMRGLWAVVLAAAATAARGTALWMPPGAAANLAKCGISDAIAV